MAYQPTFRASGEPNGDAGSSDTTTSFDLGTPAPFLGGNDGDSGGPNGGIGGAEFDPDIHIGRDKLNADGSYRRKRGRKSGATAARSRSKADNQASIDGLTRVLSILHVGLASVSKTPELVLQDDEATMLAASTARVLEEFDIRPDPKIEAIIGLVTACGIVYGPRVYMITERKKREREDKD